MGEKGLNTNLAAEYHVLSMLYRMGADAHLTLGNKKAVDILVHKGGKMLTADVKGLKGTSNFPIDNWKTKLKNHYLIFVSFRERISDPSSMPEVYIVPSLEMERQHVNFEGESLIYKNPKGNRVVVPLSRLRKLGKKYRDKWDYFL